MIKEFFTAYFERRASGILQRIQLNEEGVNAFKREWNRDVERNAWFMISFFRPE